MTDYLTEYSFTIRVSDIKLFRKVRGKKGASKKALRAECLTGSNDDYDGYDDTFSVRADK